MRLSNTLKLFVFGFLFGFITACSPSNLTQPDSPKIDASPVTAPLPSKEDSLSAMDKLNTLPVVDNRTWHGDYKRVKDFGKPWTDVDHNGCDTRDDILGKELTNVRTSDNGCTVFEGDLTDPYTGENIHYGRGKHSGVDIDHIIPLHRAWILGAYNWDANTRLKFANDPRNLIAVGHKANVEKSDKGPGEWMPANKAYHCTYAYRYIDVAFEYKLPVTAADKNVLDNAIKDCI